MNKIIIKKIKIKRSEKGIKESTNNAEIENNEQLNSASTRIIIHLAKLEHHFSVIGRIHRRNSWKPSANDMQHHD